MELKEIKNKTNEMIKKLVNCLGLDGDYYISVTDCPIAFGNTEGISRFLTAKSPNLKSFLNKMNIDEKKKKYIFEVGLILINKKLKNVHDDKEFFVTLVHETLHSNRMLFLNSQFSETENVNSVFYDNHHFVQSSGSNKSYYADASQDILKASIDNSSKTIKKYASIPDKEKEEITFSDYNYENKMLEQYKIDETLVEIMAMTAYYLYVEKTNDIMNAIKYINETNKADDIVALTNIILRHNDLELFKWMIDPLSYQVHDVNYDYFSHYIIPDDMYDFNTIINSEELMFCDDKDNEFINSSKIR